jgi:O-antigen/teichoic acid export membrane protein
LPGVLAVPHPAPRSGLQRVLRHSSLYALGNIASRAVAFLAIPFYSRFLSPAEYGLLELVELSTQTIAIAFGLQAVGTALTRLFHDQTSETARRNVVSTALIGTAMLSACVTVASVAGAGAISRAVFHTDAWTTLLQAAFVAMGFASVVELVLVYERMRDNARFYLAYSLVTLSLNLGLNILFIGGLDAGVWGFVSSKLAVSIAGAAFLLWRLRRDVGWHWRGVYVPEFVRFGAPLILSGLSYFAVHFSDRFFLTSAVTLAELGRYALAYRFALMVNALVGDSFARSWDVSLYRHTNDAGWQRQFAQVFAYLAFALSTTGLAIAIFGPELLTIMVPASFMPPALLLPILVLAYVLRDIADFFRSLLLINKRSMWVGEIAFATAAANLLLNALMIPAYGIHGAAWATLLTWAAYLAVCWIVADREHRLPIRIAPYGGLLAAMVTVYAAAAAFRVDGFLPQAFLDGVWLTLFAGIAAFILYTEANGRNATKRLGNLLTRLLAPSTPK